MTDMEKFVQIETLDAVPARAVLLGKGHLNWSRYERIGDRYGTVGLFDGPTDEVTWLDIPELPKRGWLVAEVVETRQSDHIGDLFHGIGPGGAEVGDVLFLNNEPGELYVPGTEDTTSGVGDGYWAVGTIVGIRPDDKRSTFWFSPPTLYQLHDQTVRLYFVEEE